MQRGRRAAGRDPDASRSASPPRRTSATTCDAHARPVPLVRRHGRQPRRRHRRQVRRPTARVPAGAHRLHQGPRRATTTTSTAGPGTPTPTSCPTRSSTGSASSAPPEQHIERLEELKALGVDQFAVYLQHDDKEQTLRVYGETVIPAVARARDGQGVTLVATLASRCHATRPRQAWSMRLGCARLACCVAAVSRVWELYKAVGPATAARCSAMRLLPRADDRSMPHVWDDASSAFGEPELSARHRRDRRCRPCSRRGARSSLGVAAVGWIVGVVVGLAARHADAALPHRRARPAALGGAVSQTVPLIAFAPLVVGWGGQLEFGGSLGAVDVGGGDRGVPGLLPGRGRRAARAAVADAAAASS